MSNLLALMKKKQAETPVEKAVETPTETPAKPSLLLQAAKQHADAKESPKPIEVSDPFEQVGMSEIPPAFAQILFELKSEQENYDIWLQQIHKQLSEDPAILHMLNDQERKLIYVRAMAKTKLALAATTAKEAKKSAKQVNQALMDDAFSDF